MDIYKDEDGNKVIHHSFGKVSAMTEELKSKYGDPNQKQTNNITEMSTKQIADYLSRRSGVELIVVLPFEEYEVNAARREIQEQGPCRVLVIQE